MKIFTEELSKENTMCSDTVIHEIAKKIRVGYYHNEIDRHRIIKPSTAIGKLDPRFSPSLDSQNESLRPKFASDARFLRGCISISNGS